MDCKVVFPSRCFKLLAGHFILIFPFFKHHCPTPRTSSSFKQHSKLLYNFSQFQTKLSIVYAGLDSSSLIPKPLPGPPIPNILFCHMQVMSPSQDAILVPCSYFTLLITQPRAPAPCRFLPVSPAGKLKPPMHTYSCVMGEPSRRTPSTLDLLPVWSPVPGPYVLPHEEKQDW